VEPALRPALLLVDDDPSLLALLERRLGREGFRIRTATSGPDALRELERGWPSLIVIDLMMPRMDGVELARRVKRIADLPIIVLSAVDADMAKVDALESFAEDYVTKPFSADELIARINRILRRTGSYRSRLSLGGGSVVIDFSGREIRTDRGTLQMTPVETRFLGVLAASLDRSVRTESLLERVWPESDGADPSYVWVTLRRLRQKLEVNPDAPEFLLTERGIGYRLSSLPTPARMT
jgi:two-component system KDP operon response regulator KdpE